MTTVLYREDVAVGDEVKNGRNDRWGKVVALDVDSVTGKVLRIRVRRKLWPDGLQWEPTWWMASNISMIEKGSTK